VLSKCWEPPHIVTQHHKTTVLVSRPAVFQVILKLPFHPHTPPLFSLGSVLCLHSPFVSSSVCFRDVCKSDKNYIGVIIECNTQFNRWPDKHWKVKPIFLESESYKICLIWVVLQQKLGYRHVKLSVYVATKWLTCGMKWNVCQGLKSLLYFTDSILEHFISFVVQI
jgi:hypothetical protein